MFLTKSIKSGVMLSIVILIVGGIIFGTDLKSYIKSSLNSVVSVAKDAVPLEFELARAGDLLEEIIPEMHKHIRAIAQEEVEVAALKADISRSEKNISTQESRVETLRSNLDDITVDSERGRKLLQLEDHFDRFVESKRLLGSKLKLLTSREHTLKSSMVLLDKTRDQKRLLANKIKTLESQLRLVQAASVGSNLDLDNSALAQTDKLLGNIKQRLDVAERVLAHEARFTDDVLAQVETSDRDLLVEVDRYFAKDSFAVEVSKETGNDVY